MLARKYRSRVVGIDSSIEGIYTLSFQSLGRPYRFLPGQFLHLSIDSNYDGIGQWPDSRCFSIQNSPEDPIIKITYSVKGNYTGLMEKSLNLDSEVWLKMPYGELFQQPHEKNNTVFIAGGTGVTPFLSLFSHKSFNDYANPKIYIGFRSKKYNIFESELNKLARNSTNINYFYQDCDGIIDIEKIYKENGLGSNYFISGPPTMIISFKNYLMEHGVGANNILTDDWE